MAEAKGVASALVVANEDPQGLHRVQVRYASGRERDATHWARLATAVPGKQSGAVFLPNIGDEVLIAFEQGDVRRPYVIGALWKGSDPPPTSTGTEGDRKRLMHVADGADPSMHDRDRGTLDFAIKDGKHVVVHETSVRVHGAQGTVLTIDSRDGVVEITCPGKLVIKAGAQVSIEASGAVEIRAGATLTLHGATIEQHAANTRGPSS